MKKTLLFFAIAIVLLSTACHPTRKAKILKLNDTVDVRDIDPMYSANDPIVVSYNAEDNTYTWKPGIGHQSDTVDGKKEPNGDCIYNAIVIK